MTTIVPDTISLTTHHLHFCFRETDTVLSSGTGFIYNKEGTNYLVTNWHNVSGRNFIDGECLSDKLAIPNIVSTMFREIDNPGNCHREDLNLYRDAEMREPNWYEHRDHGRAVDVVAIPLPSYVQNNYQLFPINAIRFNDSFKTRVADEAFVVGYPFSDTPELQLPIWKRASVASEPDIELDQLPKFLLDTATRSGLSGSPVIMQRIGIHGMSRGALSGSEIIGRIRNFIGVYSGRIGVDEMKAQLGIVWKARVIDEIIEAKIVGRPPH